MLVVSAYTVIMPFGIGVVNIMEYQQLTGLQKKWAKYVASQRLRTVSLLALVLTIAIALRFHESLFVKIGVAGLLAIFAILSYRIGTFACPLCKRGIGHRSTMRILPMPTCPVCGFPSIQMM